MQDWIINVPEYELQNKSHRDYFVDIKSYDQNDIYISHINLNIEDNKIDYVDGKVVPVIRYGTPVIINSTFSGAIFLNYYYEPLYTTSVRILDLSFKDYEVALIDQDNYFLFHNNQSNAWSSPENLKSNISFYQIYPYDMIYGDDYCTLITKKYVNVIREIPLQFTDNNFILRLFISVPVDLFLSEARQTEFMIYLVMLFATLISVGIIYKLTLRIITGIKPICLSCKKIKTLDNIWIDIDEYIRQNSDIRFSHGYCEKCYHEFLDKAGLN